jgi:hypothetical protein
MSLRKFGRAILAYLFASLTVAVLAGVATEILQAWTMVTFWQVLSGLWLVTVGIPSVGWSTQQVSRVLGVRPTPVVKVRGGSIPIGGSASVLADFGRAVVGRPGKRVDSLPVADDWSIVCGAHHFTRSEVKQFLSKAWQRQRSGKHPLSRVYWVDRQRMDRGRYDALMDTLCGLDFITGRQFGSSGRLVAPPLACLSGIRHSLH